MAVAALFGTVVVGIGFSLPVVAKSPPASDEQAVRAIIERTYESYMRPIPEAPADGGYAAENGPGTAMDGYEPPYTATLGALVDRWGKLMQSSDELYILNSFDWFCQCQDNDNKTAKLVRQSYKAAGKDRIDATVLFSPGQWNGKDSGKPLLFRFKREAGAWKLDDLKFGEGGGTLRRDLASDIKDATRDQAAVHKH